VIDFGVRARRNRFDVIRLNPERWVGWDVRVDQRWTAPFRNGPGDFNGASPSRVG